MKKSEILYDYSDKIVIREPYYQTVDLDKIGKSELNHIVGKISRMKCCKRITIRETFKGYHLVIECSKECDLCRLVFDDRRRYLFDNNRDKLLRNVLWTDKYGRWYRIRMTKKVYGFQA